MLRIFAQLPFANNISASSNSSYLRTRGEFLHTVSFFSQSSNRIKEAAELPDN